MSNHAKPQTFAPLFLRLALGATFIWAGAGKLMPQDYSGPMAATLASMNEGTILQGQWPPPAAAPESEAPATPESSADAAAGDEPDPDSSAESIDDEPGAEAELTTGASSVAEPTVIEQPLTVRARRVMSIAGMLKMSADGNDQRSRLVPKALGSDAWAKSLAWAAVSTELAAGAALLFGLFSRLAALGVIGTMGTALWLTQIGPAIRSRTGDNFLGFLPKPEMASPDWIQMWNTMMWQFGLLAMAGAILFMGAGKLSLDAWVFGSRNAPKPAPRKPAYDKQRPETPPAPPPRPRRPDHTSDIELD